MTRDRSLDARSLRRTARELDLVVDPRRPTHSQRVAALATCMAREAAWSRRRRAKMREAALVHDAGKAAIPFGVLAKLGQLDEAEWLLIHEHPQIGEALAHAAGLDAEQQEWIRHHHEEWSGGGYPDGIERHELSEGAQILALADAWDVIRRGRRYQPPLPVAEALREVAASTPRQFSPFAWALLLGCVEVARVR